MLPGIDAVESCPKAGKQPSKTERRRSAADFNETTMNNSNLSNQPNQDTKVISNPRQRTPSRMPAEQNNGLENFDAYSISPTIICGSDEVYKKMRP
jgi:hypothetical protein